MQSTAGHSPMTRERMLVFEHEEMAPPGFLGSWAAERGIELVECRVDRRESIPEIEQFSALAVLGAAPSAYDDHIQPWFRPELEAIRAAVAADVPVLGICFGAQALSAALGGAVFPAPIPEIGWLHVRTRAPELIESGPWLQWHRDAFSLPPGASLLADSAAGVQAFSYGVHLAVQFHPEIDADILRYWAEADGVELEQNGVDARALLEQTARLAPQRRQAAYRLFDRFAARSFRASLTSLAP